MTNLCFGMLLGPLLGPYVLTFLLWIYMIQHYILKIYFTTIIGIGRIYPIVTYIWNGSCLSENKKKRNGNLAGTYTIKDGYNWLLNYTRSNPIPGHDQNWIWKLKALEKIKILVWSKWHGSNPSLQDLHQKGISNSSLCERCGNLEENFLHCVQNCPKSLQIWRSLGYTDPNFFDTGTSQGWIRRDGTRAHSYLFFVGMWCSSKTKNTETIAKEETDISRPHCYRSKMECRRWSLDIFFSQIL